jgi:hypothetical protein
MRIQQDKMLRQRNEMATVARLGYQGNANNNVNFGQQVLDSAGLAFDDASIPGNIHMVADGDDVLSQDYTSPRGVRWMLMIWEYLGISPDDVALERDVPSAV